MANKDMDNARNPTIAASELAQSMGLSQRSIERNLEKLRQQGLLERVGPARGGHWQVIAAQGERR